MKGLLSTLYFALIASFTSFFFVGNSKPQSINMPVIGILTVPEQQDFEENGKFDSFIHAQYIKFVEQAGAVVVPILYNNTYEETEHLLNHINGVLFTGGALSFNSPKTGQPLPYTQTAIHIYNKAIELNNNGVHFPIWGTWMGFQLMMYLRYGSEKILNFTDAEHTSDPLIFNFTDYKKTKLFSDFPQDLIEKVQTDPLTANFHGVGVFTSRFLEPASNISNFYRLLATSNDRKGVNYVANVEAIDYPFFASQYHPEVTEYTYSYNFTNHSEDAREFAYYLALKFVGEARKNDQKFDTYEELVSKLVQTQGFDNMGIEGGTDFYDNYFFLGPQETEMVSE